MPLESRSLSQSYRLDGTTKLDRRSPGPTVPVRDREYRYRMPANGLRSLSWLQLHQQLALKQRILIGSAAVDHWTFTQTDFANVGRNTAKEPWNLEEDSLYRRQRESTPFNGSSTS